MRRGVDHGRRPFRFSRVLRAVQDKLPACREQAHPDPAQQRRQKWLGGGLIAMGVGLAVTSVLGPLVTGIIRYRVTGLMRTQLEAADAVSLIVVAPVSVALGMAALRGARLTAPLALVPATYTLYMVTEVILGPDYSGIPGNVERFFPLLLGLLLVAGAVGVGAWSMTGPSVVPALSPGRARLTGGVLAGTAVLLVIGRYVPALADAMSAHPTSLTYRASPTIFWTIALEDLVVVIPTMLVAGIGTWRGSQWAVRARSAIVGWSATVPLAILAMSIAMYAEGESGSSPADIAVLAAFSVTLLVPAVLCYAPTRGRAGSPMSAAAAGHSA